MNKDRIKHLPFATPLWEEPVTFVVHSPKESYFTLYARPFSSQVWLALVGIMVLLTIVLFWMSHVGIQRRNLPQHKSLKNILNSFETIYASQFNQGENLKTFTNNELKIIHLLVEGPSDS